jgi:GT2 family glycosyltransferase
VSASPDVGRSAAAFWPYLPPETVTLQHPMRVLAHIHTFNDGDFIGRALDALRRQTRQPDAIVIVDNASTDDTLDRTFPANVTIIRNPENLGSSGAVGVGFTHALKEKFDWIWVLDGDSVPEPDALANLLAFFECLPPTLREQVCFVGCRVATDTINGPILLTESGLGHISLTADMDYCRCDCFIWSGSLFRMSAVAKIGLPSADYVVDWSELEYGYRASRLGFSSYALSAAVIHQDVGRSPGTAIRTWRFGPLSFRLHEMSPLRCYYAIRNPIYFWLYQWRPVHLRWSLRIIIRGILFPRTFVVRPLSHRRHLVACLRGLWDGVTGHMERRY